MRSTAAMSGERRELAVRLRDCWPVDQKVSTRPSRDQYTVIEVKSEAAFREAPLELSSLVTVEAEPLRALSRRSGVSTA